MYKKLLFFLIIFTTLITIDCGLFEPEQKNGSISIQLVSRTDNAKLSKSQETLYTVQCIVKKGSSEIHKDDYFKNSSGDFKIEIDDLEPADNYSILLYGKNSSGDIIGRAYRSSISVKAGDETSVSMSWIDVRPVLSSPANGSTITDDTPTFDWSDVSNASTYELEVDNSSSFSSPEIDQNSLISSSYTATSSLSDDTYYWRVRCKDSQGNWGGWSDTWSFTIDINTVTTPTFDPSPATYTTAQTVTIYCSTSDATIHYTTNGLDPTESDQSVSSGGTVYISSTTTLKAKAYKSGWTASSIASGTYTITCTVATPTFDPSPGTYATAQDVMIICSTSGATIHYTTNGSDPTESDQSVSSGGTVHISSTTTLKAKAYKSGWTASDVATGTYTITGTVATPTFSPSPGTYTSAQTVSIYCSTSGATIHYTTNGSDPTESDQSVSSGGTVHISSTTTLKAKAYKNGWTASSIASGTYTITGTVATPTFVPSPGTYTTAQYITISCSTSGATIHYTTNGSDPTESDPSISSGSSVNISSTTTLKARAYKSGWTASDVTSGTYTIMEQPTLISPENSSTTTDNTPYFNWSSVSGASYYELEVDKSSSFSSPAIDQASLTSPDYTPSSSLSDDTYYWRVRAKDSHGNWGGWSSTWSFTIETVTGTVTDIDGNVYQTVKIGNQWWMAENLKVTHYRNGNPIPNVTSDSEWSELSTGAYCVYDNDESYADTYGYLYNAYAVNDSRNIAPEGWHVPTDEEWKELEMSLDMSQSEADNASWRGTNEGNKLKSTSGWYSEGNGNNESGFTALPGGHCDSGNGNFFGMEYRAQFWTSTEDGTSTNWNRQLYYDYSNIYRSHNSKRYGFSIRLVRD